MKIGLVGNGGREHAVANALTRNQERDLLFVFASYPNPGIERIAEEIAIGSLTDVQTIEDYFASNRVDLVVIGPEAPMMVGLVDQLRSRGIPAVGPTQSQARLESDKTFMRELLQSYIKWGSPMWQNVKSGQEVMDFISKVGEVAVKPVGLTGGKGVRVMGVHLGSVDEAVAYAGEWIKKDGRVLLEERLVGEEFSRMVFASDGKLAPMPVAQDFKYAYDGDKGPMTGGMGSYTMSNGSMPFLNPDELAEADKLMQEVIDALAVETGCPYRGVLYGQFMVTAKGIRVIEFNVRFGDPEAINVMALLQSDAPLLFLKVANGQLDADEVVFTPQASLCKYLVPQEYPDKPSEPIIFDLNEERTKEAGLSVILASVKKAGSRWEALGSRTLAVVGLGEDAGFLSEKIEKLLEEIEPASLRHRKDVGNGGLIRSKTEHMRGLRSGR